LQARKNEYKGKKQMATKSKPTYFNSGCCCYNDGDITGIEIADGFIRLVKWESKSGPAKRMVLEESPLDFLLEQLTREGEQ
jgi:hypothetical protein